MHKKQIEVSLGYNGTKEQKLRLDSKIYQFTNNTSLGKR